ncbi:ubiquitin-related domain-containing protein [Dimargaris cristalligena]|uniref:Ubiquitin-related domain-containing protein n=1 Tax=Dimargaris cristalligena TaxID=215637 RepID=A0A4P9ZW20_9FUNG|nr:ubiquitin-related domain-containing protein [Dimargaris cristalligena]|eukprot:RKP37825.1 ubiquitin-related domain-containing protein [Dimargaris cristalligena]
MSNSNDKQALIDMGFPEERVELALAKTKNQGLQAAMDWILSHPEGTASDSTDDGEVTQPTAQSLKCNECQKLFRNAEFAEAHASRTGHVDFSESTEAIKPLTAEEKAQKLQDLKERMSQKKAERLAQEATEAREREKMRRQTGKEYVETKESIKEKQILREIELRKQEKREEQLARQRIKQRIEEDKRERAAKREIEKNQAAGIAAASPVHLSAQEIASSTKVATTGYEQARVQIRPMSGSPITHNFDADDTLAALYDFVREKTGVAQFKLMTTFPRQVLGMDQGQKTLRELKLVPSAALVMSSI